MNSQRQPQLYFDSQCPLCKKEISLLKRLTKGSIDFIDIHSLDEENLPDRNTLLKRLHLRKADGKWLIGLDANVFIWGHTPYGFAFKLLRLWPLKSIADRIYSRWADRRFNKRYQCQTCST